MSDGNTNSADAWLQRNLLNIGASRDGALLAASANSFRLHVLRLMLVLAAVAVASNWYLENNLHLINVVDRIAYPLLLLVTSLGPLLLTVRPGSLPIVLTTVFATLITYLVADYYYILAYQMSAGPASSYQLASLALWLPLGYVASYVFYSPRAAIRTSLAIYVAISLPQWFLSGSEATLVDRQIIIGMLISHPVYIAALWGVARLKSHVSGVHDLAKNMSLAATEDPLTGIANRRAMLQALKNVTHALARAERPLALLLFDVDHFKRINDTFGHAVGDEVLIAMAHQTKIHLRGSDLLGRWGGEEFMILALDQTQAQAVQMAERLRTELQQVSYSSAGMVTISIGVTMYIPGEDIDRFIKRADDALYRAKEQGRNRVEGLFGNMTEKP